MKKEPYDTGGRYVPPVSQKVEVLNDMFGSVMAIIVNGYFDRNNQQLL